VTWVFVYEGENGLLEIQEGGFADRGFVDAEAGPTRVSLGGPWTEDVDVLEEAAVFFNERDPVRLVSGRDSVGDVELGRFRITIERLDA
jgi:hypothetical protein